MIIPHLRIQINETETGDEGAQEAHDWADEDDGATTRRDRPRPPTRRSLPTSPGLGAWEFIDTLDVDPFTHMPDGVATVEVIPISLQEEWTDAWNCVHRFRQSAVSQEDKDIALKRIMWLPQRLLHAMNKEDKDGLMQYMEQRVDSYCGGNGTWQNLSTIGRGQRRWRKRDMKL